MRAYLIGSLKKKIEIMNIKLLLNLHKNQEYSIHKSIWQMPWMHCVQICKVNQYS